MVVDRIKHEFSVPISTGKTITLLLISLAVMGTIFLGIIKLLYSNMIELPINNRNDIIKLNERMLINEECIKSLQFSIEDIKENQKEMSRDIKDILKSIK